MFHRFLVVSKVHLKYSTDSIPLDESTSYILLALGSLQMLHNEKTSSHEKNDVGVGKKLFFLCLGWIKVRQATS